MLSDKNTQQMTWVINRERCLSYGCYVRSRDCTVNTFSWHEKHKNPRLVKPVLIIHGLKVHSCCFSPNE